MVRERHRSSGRGCNNKNPKGRRSGLTVGDVFYLAAKGVRLPNFANNFDVVDEECRLSDTTASFILPLYLLEAGFQLPLHPFFYIVLKEYGVARKQLTIYRGGLWW
ncbi:hypothetical protein J1N35_007477 [Gossypium stocksii]|uniref:Uncharacterized protein n=1 Tax=Gossypium stocksii TaxID=47602 RepID=A0A9D3W656_9ROSI|nr:hypothetical protein J1N35_007477 [Gossypium stocksii]